MLQQCSTAPLVEGLFPVAVPKNVATLILSYLQPVDLLSASLVSKRWREYADSTELWATFAQTLGARRLRLEVEPDNEHAVSLYRRLGYRDLPYRSMVKDEI